jgi:hypothetical protein
MPENTTDSLVFNRDEEFTTLYANNVQFEPSVWDLKTIFGLLDQSKGPGVIEQHTAIAMSWPEAKLAAYFLLLNILAHEAKVGPIQLPPYVVPKRPDTADPSLDELGKRLVRYFAWVHDQFFSDHPYIPAEVSGESEEAAPQT